MVRVVSALTAIETAYRIDLPADEWLQCMGESVLRLAGGDGGLVSFLFDASLDDKPVDLSSLRVAGDTSPQLWENSRSFHQRMTGATYRLIFPGPGRPSINGPVTQHLRSLGLEPAGFPPLVDLLSRLGVPELWSLWAVVDGTEGVGFVRAMPGGERPSSPTHEWWEDLGAHIAAGYRARLALAGVSPLDAADAVFRPDGTPVSATDPRKPRIDTWSRIVRAIDRARAADFRTGENAVLEVWSGIIEGRWSLFDHVDTDGKRYVVLVETGGSRSTGCRALSSTQREVCLRAARGLSNKEIAYELGMSLSSVATHLRRGLEKLGISGRSRLQRLGPLMHGLRGSTPEAE